MVVIETKQWIGATVYFQEFKPVFSSETCEKYGVLTICVNNMLNVKNICNVF